MPSAKSTRFSGGGGGSSRNFPWSSNADVIQWGGGGSSNNFQKEGARVSKRPVVAGLLR